MLSVEREQTGRYKHEKAMKYVTYYYASAAVAVDSSHTTASSSAAWSRFSPPSNFVNGHVSTMWFMVCGRPRSKEGDWVRPHLCKLARRGPCTVLLKLITKGGSVAEWLACWTQARKGLGSNRSRVTVLGKLFTPIVPLFTKH